MFPCLQHGQGKKFLLVFNLNLLPLPISYVSPISSESFWSLKKWHFYRCDLVHFEIVSVFVEVFGVGTSVGTRQVLTGIPKLCHMPLHNWRFHPKSLVTVWPEFIRVTKEYQQVTTLMTCGRLCFVLSCLWPHPPRSVIWLHCETTSQLEFSS